MPKIMLARGLAAAVLLVAALGACSDSGHKDKGAGAPDGDHAGAHGDHTGDHGDHAAAHGDPAGAHGAGSAVSPPTSLAEAWTALIGARDAIAAAVENGALKQIHAKAEPLPDLAAALVSRSQDLDAGKLARIEGAAKQVSRVSRALHDAADEGNAERTRKELGKLDGLLELLRAQYPAEALRANHQGQMDHDQHSSAPSHDHAAHAERPTGVVDAEAQAVVRVKAFDPFRFEPKRIEVRAGLPTRIELENVGLTEHALVVKSPDGKSDWVHLHVPPGATEVATYRLDEPGTYPLLCTIPGHTEAGMVGELVVTPPPGIQK